MYCTLYTEKSNQLEDSQNYMKIAKNLGTYIKRQETAMAEVKNYPSAPFQIGYS